MRKLDRLLQRTPGLVVITVLVITGLLLGSAPAYAEGPVPNPEAWKQHAQEIERAVQEAQSALKAGAAAIETARQTYREASSQVGQSVPDSVNSSSPPAAAPQAMPTYPAPAPDEDNPPADGQWVEGYYSGVRACPQCLEALRAAYPDLVQNLESAAAEASRLAGLPSVIPVYGGWPMLLWYWPTLVGAAQR